MLPNRKPPQPPPEPDRTPRVVLQPSTYRGMQKGIARLVGAIRPTLGPLPRIVAMARRPSNQGPELLDNGGLIARRIVALPNRDADMGAMLLRSLLWRLHERHGDGTATAAVIFQTVFDRGVRHIVAGGNAMRLRAFLEDGLRLIVSELGSMAVRVQGERKLAQMAEALCFDPPLARVLGEVVDVVGEFGQIEVREGRGRGLDREYFDGSYWNSGVRTSEMLKRGELKANLIDAAIVISDLPASETDDVVPAIELAKQVGYKSLLFVTGSLTDRAASVVQAANRAKTDFRIVVVKTPGTLVDDQMAGLEDLALLSGGRRLLKAAGQSLNHIRAEDLGRARTAWADRSYFGLAGGHGSTRDLRQHLARLKEAHARAETTEARQHLQQRIGKLSGGAATVWIGGATEPEVNARKESARRTVAALRDAAKSGVVPGGGAALLATSSALRERQRGSTDPDERAAYRILLAAVETPFRTIITNTGLEPGRLVAEVHQAGPGYGYDVKCKRVSSMLEAGVFDVATVQQAAVHGAVSTAALALTVDVLVQHKKPPTVYTP